MADVTDQSTKIGALPDRCTSGRTLLVAAAGSPTRDALTIRLLSEYGGSDATAHVVATTERAEATLDTYDSLAATEHPSLGIVDTRSANQYVSAVYDQPPVVFTPAPGDLERLVLAEISDRLPPATSHHLVVRSLTPILETTPTERVCSVLERITGLRSKTGLGLLGIDYTAHDESTMQAVAEPVDGVLWARHSDGDVAFEYQSCSDRRLQPSFGGTADD